MKNSKLQKAGAVVLAIILAAVSVIPAFAAGDPLTYDLPYRDVKKSAWYAEDLRYMFACDYMSGTSKANTTFAPDDVTTRAMVVTILYRVAGEPSVKELEVPAFKDVPKNSWYKNAVTWAYSNGTATGYGNGYFGSNDPITREQLVTMIYRYEQMNPLLSVEYTKDYDTFDDVKSVSSWAKEPFRWAVSAGIIKGIGARLAPRENAIRAQIAAMIARYGRMRDSVYEIPYVRPEYAAEDWRSHPQDYKLVAFTFDDVPSFPDAKDNTTVGFIDALNRYEGAGTLFVHGKNLAANGTELLRYGLAHGFEIGNHTYEHLDLKNVTDPLKILREFSALDHRIEALLGVKPRFIRTGGLSFNETVGKVTTDLSMPLIRGDVIEEPDLGNEGQRDAFIRDIQNGSIVLIHGFQDTSFACFEEVLQALYNDGFRFCTLTELFDLLGIKEIPTDTMLWNVSYLIPKEN